MAHAFWHLWGPERPEPKVPPELGLSTRDPNAVPQPIPLAQPGQAELTPATQTSGTGPAYQPGFWEMLGRSQMDPRTIKILRDREAAMVAEGEANEAARQENARNRMLASTRYIDPDMKMALLQDPTGAQGLVAKQYAPPKEDDDWLKKMMQYSFMQSMMPEPSEYTGTSKIVAGPKQRDFFDIPYYGSPYPGGTNV